MKFSKPTFKIKSLIAVFILTEIVNITYSQSQDSTKVSTFFSGSILVTNNGISNVPSNSLDKPAVMFDMNMGKGRLSFEPELRFSYEGTPWSFQFWWRYKLIRKDKFRFNIGLRPSVSFRDQLVTIDSVSKTILITRRYLAGEFSPSYQIHKNIRLGIYYLYSHGLNDFAMNNIHFLSLRSTFSNITLSDQFSLNYRPQFFYLNVDEGDGLFTSSTLTLVKKNFPITLSSIITNVISSNIDGKNLVWNVSLIYDY